MYDTKALFTFSWLSSTQGHRAIPIGLTKEEKKGYCLSHVTGKIKFSREKTLASRLCYLCYQHRDTKHAIHSLLELSNFLGILHERQLILSEGKHGATCTAGKSNSSHRFKYSRNAVPLFIDQVLRLVQVSIYWLAVRPFSWSSSSDLCLNKLAVWHEVLEFSTWTLVTDTGPCRILVLNSSS